MIQTRDELKRLADNIRETGCVALDTEFVWERTFYPRLGLIQAGIPGMGCFLVEATTDLDLSPLGEVLADKSIVKILHDANQDLTILRRATGAYPLNIFDTRCAAGFVGLTATISLQDLIDELMGVKLDKSETRTDWTQRPLSERQISYALDDVRYLPKARDELLKRAVGLRHDEWLAEELTHYDTPGQYDERDPRIQFERVKGMGRLPSRKLAVLREVTAWREMEARRRDIPRDHVIPDRVLLAVAQQLPKETAELAPLHGVSRNGLSRYGKVVIEKVLNGLNVPKQHCPPMKRRHRRANVKTMVDKALTFLRERCEHAHVDPTLVATRSDLTSLAHEAATATAETHRLLRGWRLEFIGGDLAEMFRTDSQQ